MISGQELLLVECKVHQLVVNEKNSFLNSLHRPAIKQEGLAVWQSRCIKCWVKDIYSSGVVSLVEGEARTKGWRTE